MPSKTDLNKQSKEKKEAPKTSAMRNPALYILTIVVLVVVFVSFIIGPVLTQSGAASGDSVVYGEYDGEDIELTSTSYFARLYSNYIQQAQQTAAQNGTQIGLSEAYQALRNAFDGTVFRLGTLGLAEEAGVIVSEEETNRTIIQQGYFNDENGDYSQALFEAQLEQTPTLVNDLNTDIVVSKVQNDIFGLGALSDAERDFILAMNNDKRIFDLVAFSFDSYPADQVARYVSDNSELFRAMEISTVTVSDLEEAEKILERIRSGAEPLAGLARTNSSDVYAANGGSRGDVWYYSIRDEFEDPSAADVLFALEPGEVSDVFEVTGGKYVIYQADSAVRDMDTDSAVEIQLAREYILDFDKGRVSDYFRIQAEQFIARSGEIGWASSLVESGLTAITTSEVGINYGAVPVFTSLETASFNVLTGASTRENVITELFSLDLDELSSAIELRDKIVVARYAEPGSGESGQADFLSLYIPYVVQDYLQAAMMQTFSDPSVLTDQFDVSFARQFLGSN